MSKLVVLGAVLVLLDVFPGGGCGCTPSTTAGPCKTTCDCNQNMNAPLRCIGQWECNPQKVCEYGCKEVCAEDGGCPTGQVCQGITCKTPLTCP